MAKSKKARGNRPERREYSLVDVSFEHLLGCLIIAWNNAEKSSKLLLNYLLGHPPGIFAVTNELNGQSLWYALKASATTSAHQELSEHVLEIATAIERLNEHRNYYVHGAIEKKGQYLVLRTEYAKSVIREYEDNIEKSEIFQLVSDCEDTGMAAIELTSYLILKRQGQSVSLPDRHFLPPQLNKTRRNR